MVFLAIQQMTLADFVRALSYSKDKGAQVWLVLSPPSGKRGAWVSRLSELLPIEVDVEIGKRSMTVKSPKIDPALVFFETTNHGAKLPVRRFIDPK